MEEDIESPQWDSEDVTDTEDLTSPYEMHEPESLQEPSLEDSESDESIEKNSFNPSISSAVELEKKQSLSCAKVVIDACLGSFNIDFDRVNRLQKGDLIALEEGYKGSISLRNNGVEIGCAELIAVNDQVALKIQKVWR